MSTLNDAVRRWSIVLLLPMLLLGCAQSIQGVDPGEDPAQDPEPEVQPLATPTPIPVSPTPLPKGQAQFSISRSGTMTVGLGGTIEVNGEFPVDITFSAGEEAGPEILYSEGDGSATMTTLGEGPVGTGEMIGVWDVKFKVVGVFLPAPECSLELSITETWQPGVEITMIVNGQEIMTGEAETEFIIWENDVHEFGNVKFPLGVGQVVEDYIEPTTDWINTYEVTALDVPEFTGCSVGVETIDP